MTIHQCCLCRDSLEQSVTQSHSHASIFVDGNVAHCHAYHVHSNDFVIFVKEARNTIQRETKHMHTCTTPPSTIFLTTSGLEPPVTMAAQNSAPVTKPAALFASNCLCHVVHCSIKTLHCQGRDPILNNDAPSAPTYISEVMHILLLFMMWHLFMYACGKYIWSRCSNIHGRSSNWARLANPPFRHRLCSTTGSPCTHPPL